MTGFSAVEKELIGGRLVCEIRSVNSRFLDLHFRLSDDLRSIEPAIRELINAQVARGKVEIRLYWNRGDGPPNLALSPAALAELARAANEVKQSFPDAQPLLISEILRWPGVVADQSVTAEALREHALQLVAVCLEDFNASRHREGASLGEAILSRVSAMKDVLIRLAPLVPELVLQQSQKLNERMRETLSGVAPQGFVHITPGELSERIRQEATLFGLRIDVSEELTRLGTHLKEVESVLKKGGPVGKRLDFLMQELNREANTLGSKAGSVELSQAAMELKLLIEQKREQVQNLE